MQTERVTFLATPQTKALLAQRAAARGVSMGEYVRRRLAENDDDELVAAQEEELAAMVRELVDALPDMRARLRRSAKRIERNADEIDRMMRDAGIRK